MENFLKFLKNGRRFLTDLPTEPRNIHFILGNESCDLDSTISSLLLGFFTSRLYCNKITIPILNVCKNEFSLRTENCYVLNEAGIPLNDLTFRDEVNFEELIAKYTITVSLVDHHVLAKNDSVLAPFVIEIFDHRPVDLNDEKWDKNLTKIRIEPVGSCCTLIADEYLELNAEILDKTLSNLLYQTIIYDTIALKPENHKVTRLDKEIAEKLAHKFNLIEDYQGIFDVLWKAHNDIKNLTPNQLLIKDLKLIEGVYIPGLPLLVEDFLKLTGAVEALEEFAAKNSVSCILLMGLDATNEVKRDLALFSTMHENSDELKNSLVEILTQSEEAANFQYEKRDTIFDSNKIILMHIYNIKISRKQIVPLVRRAWQNYLNKMN